MTQNICKSPPSTRTLSLTLASITKRTTNTKKCDKLLQNETRWLAKKYHTRTLNLITNSIAATTIHQGCV